LSDEKKSPFGSKMPLEESTVALLAMRKRNRLELADRYHRLHSPRRRGWAPHSETEERRIIESISRRPQVLKNFIEDNQINFKHEVAKDAHAINEGDELNEHAGAFERLAMIASDPELCGKGASIAALKTLALESLIHNTSEAKKALESVGWKLDEAPRLEIVALITPAWVRWFSGSLKKAMREIERKIRRKDDDHETSG